MARRDYSEHLLIQAPTAELLEQTLGWQAVFAQDDEDFGEDSLLGRSKDTEVVLRREVLAALQRLNPGLPTRGLQPGAGAGAAGRHHQDPPPMGSTWSASSVTTSCSSATTATRFAGCWRCGRDVQKALAALALTRHDCVSPALTPVERFGVDNWRAEVLDRVEIAKLPEVLKNRLHLRKAGVWASLAWQRARRPALGPALAAEAATRALSELAAINKSELAESDAATYSDAALRVGASRWAAEPGVPAAPVEAAVGLAILTRPGQPGETCINLVQASRGAQVLIFFERRFTESSIAFSIEPFRCPHAFIINFHAFVIAKGTKKNVAHLSILQKTKKIKAVKILFRIFENYDFLTTLW